MISENNNENLSGDWESPVCLFCGKSVTNIFPEGDYRLNLVPPAHVVRCPDCGLTFLCPRPGGLSRRALLKGDVPQQLSAYDNRSANYAKVNENRSSLFTGRIDRIKNIAGIKSVGQKPITILDVGASGGTFLKVSGEKGFNSFGIEPSNAAFYNKDNNKLVQSMSENIPFPNGTFDVVHAHHVIEHLHNPLKACLEIYRTLKPGGLFFLEVPNQFDNIMFIRDSLLHRLKQRKRNIRSIHHLYFFSRNTIEQLLAFSGFEQIKIKDYYSWKSRGWRFPLSVLTRFAGIFWGGGDLIQAWGLKRFKE